MHAGIISGCNRFIKIVRLFLDFLIRFIMPRSFDLTPLKTLLKTRPYSIFFSFEIISLTPYVIKQFKKTTSQLFSFLNKISTIYLPNSS